MTGGIGTQLYHTKLLRNFPFHAAPCESYNLDLLLYSIYFSNIGGNGFDSFPDEIIISVSKILSKSVVD